ncbi:hypothetical protein CDO52_15755 [Nocardiopsis gilva YIM 90087]|uniref:Tn3 transposase DDE domain-containing protein n=2 Tax=Nocardiopsis gilva TaxID=280236 RepID=A0A223S7G2_9ACTN|nr:hypothetical protein CDO52_15755 [Nocardiopsis gilva YIM 90087]
MLSREGHPTGLGDACAHYGRIFKTLHLLQFLHGEPYRRMITAQVNVSESRHRVARKICFNNRGGTQAALPPEPGGPARRPPAGAQHGGVVDQPLL